MSAVSVMERKESYVDSNSTSSYLKEIGRAPLLTSAEEVDLAKRIEAGVLAQEAIDTTQPDSKLLAELEWVAADGQKAKEQFIEANLRLVVSVAKKYMARGVPLLDLTQDGNLGLIRAVEKFDYTKGYKFSTYAMWWIRQAITRSMEDQARTIRIPTHMIETINKVAVAQQELVDDLGREPTIEELANKVEMTCEKVIAVQKYGREPISLHTQLGDDAGVLSDIIEDMDAPNPSEYAEASLLRTQLDEILDTLTPREADIVRLRFGFTDQEPKTLKDIGEAYGLTRERIRQVEAVTLQKLRHPSRAQKLQDYL